MKNGDLEMDDFKNEKINQKKLSTRKRIAPKTDRQLKSKKKLEVKYEWGLIDLNDRRTAAKMRQAKLGDQNRITD